MKSLLSFKMLRIMKLTFLILLMTCLQVVGRSRGQTVTLSLKNASVQKVFREISRQTGVSIVYNEALFNGFLPVTIKVKDASISEVMDKCLKNQPFTYSVEEGMVVVKKSSVPVTTAAFQAEKTVSPPIVKTITGQVTDEKGQPQEGATIAVKATTNGVKSDADGNFSIDAAPNSILVISHVGFETKEIKIGNQANITVQLKAVVASGDEVVVVGYGTQKKRDVLGSISTIKSSVLETPAGSSNFNSLLQGQAAGVSVQSSSGRLGAGVNIMIRGLSSISAGTDPLWIIDGVPIITYASVDNNGSAPQSPMQLINQTDIESIQVLKDAAATSIYGSRGSNGVIIVTTKSGVSGKASVNIDYSTGISDLPGQKVNFLNTTQWLRIKDEAKEGYGLGAYTMSDFYSKRVYATEFLTREQAAAINTDWRKATMQKGSFQNVNFSTVGGGKAVRYFVSSNYRKDKSVMTNEDLERYGVRANVDIKPTNSFDFGTKINLSLSKSNRGKNSGGVEDGNSNGTAGGFSFVNSATVPLEPVYSLANPKLYYNPYTGNPVATSDRANMVEGLDMYRVLTNIYGEYTFPFMKGLSVRSEVSIDFLQANRNFWVSNTIRYFGSLAQDNASTTRTVNYNAFLKYNKVIGNNNLNVVAGTESQRYNSWYRTMEGRNLIGTYQQLGSPSLLTGMFSGLTGETYLKSYFGRANYKFKDKYLAGISVRRDGASVFTSDYRWGNFVAYSAGWIVSDENFMSGFGKNNLLKIRGSYGKTGNANIPGGLNVSNYQDNWAYGSADILGSNGTILTSIGVNNLRWESTKNLDLGIDFGFFNHRIDGSIAYYNKYVKDLLLESALPPSSGIGSIWGNIGDLVNSGVELSVSSYNLESKNFKWSTTLNVAFNHNEVKKLTPQVDQAGTGMVSVPYITKVGSGIRDYYLADFAGIDPATGLGQIYALDEAYYEKTGVTRRLNDDQGKNILLVATSNNTNTNLFHLKGKNQMPTYFGGVTNKLTYKAFDLSFLITFSGGNYILDNFRRDLETANANGEMLADFDQNYWKKPGDRAKYQRLDYLGNIKMEDGTVIGMGDSRTWTNQFLFKGDFVKLKSVSLGYTFPATSVTKKIFQGFRLYATLENLYTITKYPGWDPEGQGLVTAWDLPQLFSASVGAIIKF